MTQSGSEIARPVSLGKTLAWRADGRCSEIYSAEPSSRCTTGHEAPSFGSFRNERELCHRLRRASSTLTRALVTDVSLLWCTTWASWPLPHASGETRVRGHFESVVELDYRP